VPVTLSMSSQRDRAVRKQAHSDSAGWNRDRMTETHRKGKRHAKKVVRRAGRRVGKEEAKDG
jgi:hypothetical protein